MTQAIHYTCEGESHKATNKVCQDYSLVTVKDGLAMAIVCDGHGGERYFRSNIGSKYAAEATLDAVTFFIENMGVSLLTGCPYTAVGPASARPDNFRPSDIDKAFHQLFASIIYKWNTKIDEHAHQVPFTEWELANVPKKYLDEFAACIADPEKTVEKQYGCTLMAYVQTKTFWFAFHIGDGKCLAFQKSPIWNEPIPWDNDCFLNKTTSLCDPSCIDEFRYCYCGDGTFPMAVILGSDGLDDSLGEETNLANFYIQILKMLVKEGVAATETSLKETLPQLSRIGSKDDMSVASVFDLEALTANINIFILYQLDLVKDQLADTEARIHQLIARRESLATLSDEKSQIEFKYALQDLEKAYTQRTNLVRKYQLLADEQPHGSVPPYVIEDAETVDFSPNAETDESKINTTVPLEADTVTDNYDTAPVEVEASVNPQKSQSKEMPIS